MANSPTWIETAAAHGATKWIKQFIQTQIPPLLEHRISPDEFAQALDAELQTRNLLTSAQQKNYRSNIVQALKTINPTHPAIAIVAPTTEQYRDLNDAQRGKLAERETQYFTSAIAQQLVDRATTLLDSAEWSDVGAGLAVLIGRRISEILLSKFELKSPWSIAFSEMAKKADAQGVTIEIPTLAPAQRVIAAIEKLQQSLKIEDLKLASLSPKQAKQAVNGKFSNPVSDRCDQHFCDLIPPRTDRDNLYTHVFRAVYATIAAHWFCPPNVPEHNFKAEIQGHFTLSQDGKKLPNFSARANYDDYAIGSTENGNRDGRLGIKLGLLPGLRVIDAFRKPASTEETTPMETTVAPLPVGFGEFEQTTDVDEEPGLSNLESPPSPTIKDTVTVLDVGTMNAFVYRSANLFTAHNSASVAVGLIALTGRLPNAIVKGDWRALTKFAIVDQATEQEVPTLTSAVQVLSAIAKLDKSTTLPTEELTEIARTTFDGLLPINAIQDLQAVYTKIALFRFCPEHTDDARFIEAVGGTDAPQYELASSERGTWLTQRNVEVLRSLQALTNPQPPQAMSPQPEAPTSQPAKPRYKAIKVNITQLRQVCDRIGIQVKRGQGFEQALAELLDWNQTIELIDDDEAEEPVVEQEFKHESPATDWTRALADQARTLAVLSAQVETLQHQVAQLQAERDAAVAKLNQQQAHQSGDQARQGELETLRAQNEQLQIKVKRLTRALLGEDVGEVPPQPSHHPDAIDPPQSSPPPQPPEPKPIDPPATQPQRRSRGNATDKINQIIDAFIAYNNQQPDRDLKLRISIPFIKAIGQQIGATYQPAIQQVLKDREAELEKLHGNWMLGSRHNAGVKNKDELLKTIARDFLKIDNWQQVEYSG